MIVALTHLDHTGTVLHCAHILLAEAERQVRYGCGDPLCHIHTVAGRIDGRWHVRSYPAPVIEEEGL